MFQMLNDKEEPPAILSISVNDAVKAKPVGMGNQSPEMTPEERNLRVKNEYEKLLKLYVHPHLKPGRWISGKADLERVLKEAHEMILLCNVPRGRQAGGAHAIAHTQVCNTDPLRFFVLQNGMVVINPIIVNHTNYSVFKKEGCMSFPDDPMKEMVSRYHKVVAMFQSFAKKDDGTVVLTKPMTEHLTGMMAEIFQHECQHCNGHYIYDVDHGPEQCLWLPEGMPLNLDELSALYEEEKHEEKNNNGVV